MTSQASKKASKVPKNHRQFFIRFAADNDYIYLISEFAKLIARNVFEKAISKSDIVRLFNRTALELYLILNSHKFCELDSSALDRLKEYLVIDEKCIFFNEEFEQFSNFNGDGCLAVLNFKNEIEYYIC